MERVKMMKKRIRRSGLYVLMILIMVSTTYSIPIITDASLSENSITMTGSDFGSGPNMVIFDDFEQGSSNQHLAIGPGSAQVGQWEEIGGFDPVGPVYS